MDIKLLKAEIKEKANENITNNPAFSACLDEIFAKYGEISSVINTEYGYIVKFKHSPQKVNTVDTEVCVAIGNNEISFVEKMRDQYLNNSDHTLDLIPVRELKRFEDVISLDGNNLKFLHNSGCVTSNMVKENQRPENNICTGSSHSTIKVYDDAGVEYERKYIDNSMGSGVLKDYNLNDHGLVSQVLEHLIDSSRNEKETKICREFIDVARVLEFSNGERVLGFDALIDFYPGLRGFERLDVDINNIKSFIRQGNCYNIYPREKEWYNDKLNTCNDKQKEALLNKWFLTRDSYLYSSDEDEQCRGIIENDSTNIRKGRR